MFFFNSHKNISINSHFDRNFYYGWLEKNQLTEINIHSENFYSLVKKRFSFHFKTIQAELKYFQSSNAIHSAFIQGSVLKPDEFYSSDSDIDIIVFVNSTVEEVESLGFESTADHTLIFKKELLLTEASSDSSGIIHRKVELFVVLDNDHKMFKYRFDLVGRTIKDGIILPFNFNGVNSDLLFLNTVISKFNPLLSGYQCNSVNLHGSFSVVMDRSWEVFQKEPNFATNSFLLFLKSTLDDYSMNFKPQNHSFIYFNLQMIKRVLKLFKGNDLSKINVNLEDVKALSLLDAMIVSCENFIKSKKYLLDIKNTDDVYFLSYKQRLKLENTLKYLEKKVVFLAHELTKYKENLNSGTLNYPNLKKENFKLSLLIKNSTKNLDESKKLRFIHIMNGLYGQLNKLYKKAENLNISLSNSLVNRYLFAFTRKFNRNNPISFQFIQVLKNIKLDLENEIELKKMGEIHPSFNSKKKSKCSFSSQSHDRSFTNDNLYVSLDSLLNELIKPDAFSEADNMKLLSILNSFKSQPDLFEIIDIQILNKMFIFIDQFLEKRHSSTDYNDMISSIYIFLMKHLETPFSIDNIKIDHSIITFDCLFSLTEKLSINSSVIFTINDILIAVRNYVSYLSDLFVILEIPNTSLTFSNQGQNQSTYNSLFLEMKSFSESINLDNTLSIPKIKDALYCFSKVLKKLNRVSIKFIFYEIEINPKLYPASSSAFLSYLNLIRLDSFTDQSISNGHFNKIIKTFYLESDSAAIDLKNLQTFLLIESLKFVQNEYPACNVNTFSKELNLQSFLDKGFAFFLDDSNSLPPEDTVYQVICDIFVFLLKKKNSSKTNMSLNFLVCIGYSQKHPLYANTKRYLHNKVLIKYKNYNDPLALLLLSQLKKISEKNQCSIVNSATSSSVDPSNLSLAAIHSQFKTHSSLVVSHNKQIVDFMLSQFDMILYDLMDEIHYLLGVIDSYKAFANDNLLELLRYKRKIDDFYTKKENGFKDTKNTKFFVDFVQSTKDDINLNVHFFYYTIFASFIIGPLIPIISFFTIYRRMSRLIFSINNNIDNIMCIWNKYSKQINKFTKSNQHQMFRYLRLHFEATQNDLLDNLYLYNNLVKSRPISLIPYKWINIFTGKQSSCSYFIKNSRNFSKIQIQNHKKILSSKDSSLITKSNCFKSVSMMIADTSEESLFQLEEVFTFMHILKKYFIPNSYSEFLCFMSAPILFTMLIQNFNHMSQELKFNYMTSSFVNYPHLFQFNYFFEMLEFLTTNFQLSGILDSDKNILKNYLFLYISYSTLLFIKFIINCCYLNAKVYQLFLNQDLSRLIKALKNIEKNNALSNSSSYNVQFFQNIISHLHILNRDYKNSTKIKTKKPKNRKSWNYLEL